MDLKKLSYRISLKKRLHDFYNVEAGSFILQCKEILKIAFNLFWHHFCSPCKGKIKKRKKMFDKHQEKTRLRNLVDIEPEIYRDKGSFQAGLEEVQHYPMDYLPGHQRNQPERHSINKETYKKNTVPIPKAYKSHT
jgi:hypothetical protein